MLIRFNYEFNTDSRKDPFSGGLYNYERVPNVGEYVRIDGVLYEVADVITEIINKKMQYIVVIRERMKW